MSGSLKLFVYYSDPNLNLMLDIFEANAEFRIGAEITDLTGHSFHHLTLGRGGRPNQQSSDQASVGEFAEEEYKEDDPNTPVDKVENLKDGVVPVGFIKPANHEGGALG